MAGCTSLPDTQFLSARYTKQEALFVSARGQLSKAGSAAIVAQLKHKSGNLSILNRQITLEQDIVGNPLVVGNKVMLLEDGPPTYQAMFAAIAQAKNNINMESYAIKDDLVGQQFANLLIARQAQGVQVNVIYDSYGSLNTPRKFFDRLRQAGIQVLEFTPVDPLTAKVA